MHEAERCQTKNWTTCEWMPLFDDRKSSKLPTQGYESLPARRARLEHQCLSYLLQPFEECTGNKKHSVLWPGGGDEKRDTAVYLGAVIVDHPQLDKFTGCPGQRFMCSNML
jgi:hypothetical protein